MSHRSNSGSDWKPTHPGHLDGDEPNEQRKSLNRIYGLRDDGRTARFVKTPNILNYALPLDLSYFVGVLMDWDRRKSEAVHDEWFYFPTRWIAQHFPHATPKVQRRLFRELRLRKFIYTRMEGGRGHTKRWIWIDYIAIEKACYAVMDAQFNDVD